MLWAKIDVGLRHHPKLIGRPDLDFRLWVCLILHAKEHSPDFVVRDLSPADMRLAFGIKASAKAITEALAYFISKGMLVEVEGGLLIRDMEERQGKYDREEQRAKWKEIKRRQRGNVQAVHQEDTQDMSTPVHGGHAGHVHSVLPLEVEVEKEVEKEKSKSSSALYSDPPVLPAGNHREPWDPALLQAVQESLKLTDLDHGWGQFVGQSQQYPAEARHAASREFLQRGCAKAGKDWPYLLGMIRNGAGRKTQPPTTIQAEPQSPEQIAKVRRELAEIKRQQA